MRVRVRVHFLFSGGGSGGSGGAQVVTALEAGLERRFLGGGGTATTPSKTEAYYL